MYRLWSIVPFLAKPEPILNQTTEAFFALAVRIIVAVGLTIVPPSWKEKWESWGWRNAILFGISFIFVPMLFWGLRCPGGVPIPGYVPRCSFTGVILDALYPGFFAFILNYVGEDMYQRSREWKRKPRIQGIVHLWNSLPFWLFLLTVAVEAILLVSGLNWQITLAISVAVAILTTLFGILTQTDILSKVGLPYTFAAFGLLMQEVWWWIILIVKIVVHLLPIPFWLKPLISIGLTLILFFAAHLILWCATHPRRD